MSDLIGKIVDDRRFKFFLGMSACFFLIVVMLHALERSSCIAQILFIVSICALSITILYLCFSRKEVAAKETVGPRAKILHDGVIVISYWSLVAVIVGDDFRHVWLLYSLIALTAVATLTAFVVVKKR